MKKLFTLFAIALAVVVSSCSKFDDSAIWDKLNEHEETLNDHEKRIAALEELCRQLNTNIDALQTIVEALEKRDYITNVSPVREDGEIVGYTISFANSDTITIYNGKDDNNGTGGYIPHIGVKKDVDGIYYWTIDGEWLLDDYGNKIKAVGVDGKDGANGKDGITPRLKIDNDYWYISYDEGATWIELGRATGDENSCPIVSVTETDDAVIFTLADGSEIRVGKESISGNPVEYCELTVELDLANGYITYNNLKIIIDGTEYSAIGTYSNVPKGSIVTISWTYNMSGSLGEEKYDIMCSHDTWVRIWGYRLEIL